ncbi:MAG: DoxX [Rubritepida sp.]|nr:DoxX [Rubritepida sp.]
MLASLQALLTSPVIRFLALLALCSAYIQGGLNKLLDWQGALGEAMHFGLPWPAAIAAATIVTELLASALILSGKARWFGALWLAAFTLVATFVANRFWEMPPGHERFMTANGFFEHLGLVGALVYVAGVDLARRAAPSR